ncbi:MAG: lipid A export permease/ATP-binding protein MsbA [Neisseriaceae bacterium]|nr:lipid A export permease/ATP-binding protein MsbA [Neisseriaceae bacterium]
MTDNKTIIETYSVSKKTLYQRLYRYLIGYWKIFIIAIIAMLVVAATGPAFAALIKPLINDGFVERNLQSMRWIPFAIVGLFFIRGLFNFINEYAMSYLSGHLVQRVREEMFAKIMRLPSVFFNENSSGRIVSRIINDANLMTDASFNAVTILAKDGVTVLGLLGLLLYIEWKLTLVTLIAIPVMGLCIRFSSKRLRKLSRENQQYLGKMTQVLNENIDGVRMVKIYSGQQYEQQRFHNTTNSVRHNLVKQTAANTANTSITQLLVSIALALFIYFAASRAANANNNEFNAGDFMSFLTAMVMMFDPIKRITTIMQSLQRGLAAAESVFTFLDTPEEIDNGKLNPSQKLQGNINFEKVSFRYPNSDKNSLNTIDLDIKSGQMIALVGTSGCGKTTLANLIPRFYDITSGKITLDGTNIQEYSLDALRSNMAFVSQDIVLFNDTIAHNIAYGACQNANTYEIINALKAANAWVFIENLPEGINTIVGENGAKLSGGQRQRLSIARAILKNAPILILDEATSALDSESEKQVQIALEKLMKDKTTIVIAHRLSTIEHADNIIVMHEGNIVEQGCHNELIAQGGRYAMLYATQFSVDK